ncbi:SIR2 family protein [Agrobacterium sp. lyk4-40-TYG-31]|uniref:SIR2 family protein n=1 Tax=Agrobacterium sp. lyk4-40-TYG-31 TaxID=3040276 RepID=UPI00254DAD3D|nr:SIR2 family protein [Agrobacterium sp. lyk4-40-TYG-31]
MADQETAQVRQFQFIRHGDQSSTTLDWESGPGIVQKALGQALNARNVAFLLGAGCSSLEIDGEQRGIPTMAPLAAEFCKHPLPPEVDDDLSFINPPKWGLTSEEVEFLNANGASLSETEYTWNLERLMELLFSLAFIFRRSDKTSHSVSLKTVEGIINKVKMFLWERCTEGVFAFGDNSLLGVYESFYRRLVLRDRSLPRPWIFTTNYDLFNERAMDRLGLPYTNGFSGVVERRFNPATFRYALAEQLDVTSRKWSAVDGFVYLCKLHGSLSWTEDDHGLFPIREVWPQEAASKVMIYPTPAKQNSSLGSPYSDLFREFQSRVVREQSVLITAGFAFGDEHLNNIIYQALTIPSFRLIVFANPESSGEIAKLRALSDERIWIIGGDGPDEKNPAHYFNVIVEHFMPQRQSDRIDDAVRLVIETMGATKDTTDGH